MNEVDYIINGMVIEISHESEHKNLNICKSYTNNIKKNVKRIGKINDRKPLKGKRTSV